CVGGGGDIDAAPPRAPVAGEEMGKRARRREEPRRYVGVGRIHYPESPNEPGVMLYLKPGIYGDEPVEVKGYALANSAFPHDANADRSIDDAQFEAYRSLGRFATQTVFGDVSDPAGKCDSSWLNQIIERHEGKATCGAPSQPDPSRSAPATIVLDDRDICELDSGG